jgi:hypothetical protein
VKLFGHPESTTGYIWGAQSIETFRCEGCGCVTHWGPLISEAGEKHGVNIRDFDPSEVSDVRLRRFDGAESWSYVD